jgi:hypothetical protein
LKPLLRGLFAAFLILMLAAQATRISRTAQPDESANLSDGLTSLGSRVQAEPVSERLTAIFPGCPVPVTVAPIGLVGATDDTLSVLPALDTEQRYAYLGFVGTRLDWTTIAGRWAAASALAVFGLRHSSVPVSVVLVTVPTACPGLAALDWSVLSPWS